MKKASYYTKKQLNTNNFGNNLITIECFLSADFKNQTEEHFNSCLEQAEKINSLLIDRNKCDNEEHYQQILFLANAFLKMSMIERRIGIVKND